MNERPEPVALPRGVVTFLLTDVAGSTRWWTHGGPEPATAMARQAEIIGAAVTAHGGFRPVEQGEGDSVVAVFERASDALAAAVDAQLALAAERWPGPAVEVRMAVHTGEAEFRDEQTYGGEAIIRCARLREHAQGGQVLVSAATAEIASERLPAGTSLIPLGKVSLRGLARPERVHQLVHDAVTTTLADLGPRSSRLGSWPTRLVGRAQERRDVVELVGNAHLVTITGTGGAGKTRLAHAVAVELSQSFEDVAWVELAGLTSDDEVATAVARGCGAREVPGVGTLEVLTAFLRTRNLLLVLDNCEHLLDGCAALAGEILRLAPGTRILATSRELLGVSGEVTWRIPALALPPEGLSDPSAIAAFDAVELFVDRARSADPTFVLDERTAGDVATICWRFDGLPLAIELAAARLRSMTLRGVTDALDDRFRLLTGGIRTSLPRQQTLLASVDWSYSLLDVVEQTLLRRLGVFAAPFTIEAAEAVGAGEAVDRFEVFDLMSRLVDKSLVQLAGERYRLLETIRQFALDKAGVEDELAELRDRHFEWCRNRAARWRIDQVPATEPTTAEIALESPDLVAALEWSVRSEGGPALELLWPLGWLWVIESSFEDAARWSRVVLARFDVGSRAWLGALAPLAHALMMSGDRSWVGPVRAALANGEDGVDDVTRGHLEWAELRAPVVFRSPQRLTRLQSLIERGRRAGNDALELGAGGMLAYACAGLGDLEEGSRLCDWLDRRLPHDAELRSSLNVARGYLALYRCDFDAAWQCVWDLARRRPPDLPAAVVAGLVGLYTEDLDRLAVGLDACEWTASPGAAGASGWRSWPYADWRRLFRAFGELLDGRLGEARLGLESAELAPSRFEHQSPLSVRLRLQLALLSGDAEVINTRMSELRPFLDQAALPPSSLERLARDTTPYGAASLNLLLADVAMSEGRLTDAEEAVHRALGFAAPQLTLVMVDALEALAVVLSQRNRLADAARLFGAISAFREQSGMRFQFPLRRIQLEALVLQMDGGIVAAGRDLTVAEALSLAQRTRGKRGRPNVGWDSLTPTERRVVDLVGEGRTNAEIAEKLFIGVSTVKTHLVHVYEKLGLRSRTELAAATARKEG